MYLSIRKLSIVITTVLVSIFSLYWPIVSVGSSSKGVITRLTSKLSGNQEQDNTIDKQTKNKAKKKTKKKTKINDITAEQDSFPDTAIKTAISNRIGQLQANKNALDDSFGKSIELKLATTKVNAAEKIHSKLTKDFKQNSNFTAHSDIYDSRLKTGPEISVRSIKSVPVRYQYTKSKNKVILFVWDGLRPDVITAKNTPNLYKLKQSGTFFSDHHSSYPTVTMNNANSFATGNYSGGTGFYGNKAWRPDLASIAGTDVDFMQPIYTQTHEVLKGLDQSNKGKPLMYVETLLQVARKYGLKTAQVGKAGPVALQDAHQPSKNGIILTPNKVYPIDFAKKIQQKGYYLPNKAVTLYPDSSLVLKKDNPNPTKKSKITELKTLDGKIPLVGVSHPEQASSAVAQGANDYLMNVFLKEILPEHQPDISVVWLREPDTTEHKYGPGSKPFYMALRNQDKLLGKLLLYLDKLGMAKTTNILIASDHGHSNVSADPELFPLRELGDNSLGEISENGYSVSGNVRVAHLLNQAGFSAFDGVGCVYNPVLGGVLKDGSLLNKIEVDKDGSICKEGKGRLYTSPSYIVPKVLPTNAVVLAKNSGSVYFYVPSKEPQLVSKLVRFLQSRKEFDSIFVSDDFSEIPGTLSQRMVKFFDEQQERNPDVLVSMSYNDKQIVQGLPGTIYTSSDITRGSHGSLSPVDIRNVFVAFGPDFKNNYTNVLPTANVDVPVTVAYLQNLPFNNRKGRAILEAIKGSGVKSSDYELSFHQLQPKHPARNLKIHTLLSYSETDYELDKDSYTFVLNTKQLNFNGKKYSYIDSAKAIRY